MPWDAWPGLHGCGWYALLLLDWLPIFTACERLGGACACPFLIRALPCSVHAEPIQTFHPPCAAEYGLSASVGPLSVGTLISGGDDYGLLKDSGSPVARWV